MKKIQIAAFLILTILSCRTQREIIDKFQLISTPNELDKVGTIFFIDKNGAEQPLGTIELKPIEGNSEIADIEGYKKIDGELFGQMFKLPINFRLNASKQLYYKLKYANTKLQRLQLLDIQPELQKKSFQIDKFFKDYRKPPKCYLITETYKAKEAEVIFSSNKNLIQKTGVTIKEVEATDSLSISSGDVYELKRKFDKELYVGKKVFGLKISGSGLNGKTTFELNPSEHGFIKK